MNILKNGELKRELRLGSAVIIVIANIIGTGIFTTSGLIIEKLSSPQTMLLCWIIGGVLALSGALCYGELGAMFPMAGGEYVFLRESIGKPVGFLSGWISLIVGFSAPIAAASIAFATYFLGSLSDMDSIAIQVDPNAILPLKILTVACSAFFSLINAFSSLINWYSLHFGSPLIVLAVAVIILFSLAHWYSLHFGSRVQNLLTTFKVMVILAFIICGFLIGNGSWTHFNAASPPTVILSGEFATSLIFISFAYSGWNAAAYLGSEIKNPSRNIPLSLFWGTLVVVVLYLLLNMVFIYALSPEEMGGVIDVGAKSAIRLFGVKIGGIFSMAVTICLMSVISAMIMAGPRVYYAMSRDGIFPKWFGRVKKEHGTPGTSILLQAVISILMVITSSFEKLLIYIGFTLSLFALFTVAGMILLRVRRPDIERPYKTFGYPFTPLLFILSNLWIIIYSIKSNPVVCLYGGGTILAGILVFLFFSRTRSN